MWTDSEGQGVQLNRGFLKAVVWAASSLETILFSQYLVVPNP
jgi:hypothetical protein